MSNELESLDHNFCSIETGVMKGSIVHMDAEACR